MSGGGCGRGADEDGEHASDLSVRAAAPTDCVRCGGSAVIAARDTGYCEPCFGDAFRSRVSKGFMPARQRAAAAAVALGRARGRKTGAVLNGDPRPSAMIAFSGGVGSRTAMELFKRAFVDNVPESKSEKFTPQALFRAIEVVWVDESESPGLEQTAHTEAEVRRMVEPTGFPLLAVPLSSIFDDLTSPTVSTSVSTTPPSALRTSPADTSEALRALLSPPSTSKSTSRTTSRAALHRTYVQSLLRRMARARNHDVLITGETATRIAVLVLSGVAEGRGWSLGEEVAGTFEDGTLTVVRPLGLCLDVEVRYWARMRGWIEDSTRIPTTGPKEEDVRGKKSIQQLSEEFVVGLETSFPGTVSTVIRTAGKLGLRTNDAKEKREDAVSCPVCGLYVHNSKSFRWHSGCAGCRPAQPGADNWRQAITVSSFESVPATSANDHSEAATESGQIASLLCYGCLLSYDEARRGGRPDATVLPEYVRAAARRRLTSGVEGRVPASRVEGTESLREHIQEYLIA